MFKCLCCVRLVAQLCLTLCNPMDYSPQVLYMEFSPQEYCSGLPFPSPWDQSYQNVMCFNKMVYVPNSAKFTGVQ